MSPHTSSHDPSRPHAPGSRPVAEIVEPHLLQARWFAGKGRQAHLRALTPLPWLGSTDLPAVRFEIAEMEYADAPGEVEYYLVALCYRPAADPTGPGFGVAAHPELGPVSVHSAASDPAALDDLLRFVSAEQTRTDWHTGREMALTSHLVDGSRLRTGLAPHPFTGEQSNTSILYGDVALLKLFRRLEAGHNLDIEALYRLSKGPARHRVAALYGWLEARWADSHGRNCTADLGILVEQLPHARDGWSLAVTSLIEGQDFSTHARELAVALREVHAGLAESFDVATISGAHQADAMRARASAAGQEVPEVAPFKSGIAHRFAGLDRLHYPGQRVHGDFHLGQALLTGSETGQDGQDSWRIIDFEGEPLKELDERRGLDTPWHDVAGMLRSLAYAGAFAQRNEGVTPAYADAWVATASAAFIKAYAGRDLNAEEAVILHCHELDKAVYECRYEARQRPDWLPISVAGIAALTGAQEASDE